jgi:DNA (cytosine-5)-methyltransferase 1
MKFGSLFAGIGGIDLGLERAGMECAWQVEIDDYATKVLTKHWPDVPKFRDIRECGSHNLGAVDLIAGGFPCQDISLAGPGGGLDGERSGLWTQYRRIIRELRPRFVLVENVSALLGRGISGVLGDLAESGYDAEWDCIPAAAVGAPHRRDRLFIVAYATRFTQRKSPNQNDTISKGGETRDELMCGGQCSTDVADANSEWQSQSQGVIAQQRRWISDGGQTRNASNANSQRREKQHFATIANKPRLDSWRDDAGWRQWAVEPDVGRVADGVPRRVDRLRGLGNAVVPQVAEFIGRQIMECESCP